MAGERPEDEDARYVDLLAGLAASMRTAASEEQIYLCLAEGLRKVLGDGPVLGVLEAMTRLAADALEHRRAEALLRESEERFRLVASSTTDVIYEWDIASRRVQWFGDVNALLGYEVGTLTWTLDSLLERIHPEDRERVVALTRAGLQAGRRWRGEYRVRRKDGTVAHWLGTGIGVYDKSGVPVRGLGAISDITVRRQSELALQESEEQLRALSDNLQGGLVYQIDSGEDGTQRRFTYISAGVDRLHGVTATEALHDATSIYGQIVEEDRPRLAEREASALASMKPLNAEVRLRLPSGELRWRLFTSAPRRLPDGHLVWDGIEIDVTMQKRAEEAREKLQAQLAQAQKMESVGRLAGGVAHDFNNMLVVMLGNAELALEQLGPANPLSPHLEEIRQAAEHSADLTRQLLAFARRQTIAPRCLDLSQAVAGALKMLRRLLGEEIELAWIPGEQVWPVLMDPTQLEQILANLCVNARDAIDGVGKITIQTGRRVLDAGDCAAHPDAVPGEYVTLSVSDNGRGMDPATLSKLFEPFFTTKVMGRGTGLGLSTVHGIVKQNGGHIEVVSEPGRGTTFRLFLPRFSREAGGPESRRVPPAEARGQETILLVEDEPAILKVCQRMLEALGYQVVAAVGPGEALRLAREHRGGIHLLLTDVVMPEMDGRALAGNLQSLYPDLRCLFMSGYTDEVIAHRGMLEAGVRFLQKPFSREELAAKVRAALDGQVP